MLANQYDKGYYVYCDSYDCDDWMFIPYEGKEQEKLREVILSKGWIIKQKKVDLHFCSEECAKE